MLMLYTSWQNVVDTAWVPQRGDNQNIFIGTLFQSLARTNRVLDFLRSHSTKWWEHLCMRMFRVQVFSTTSSTARGWSAVSLRKVHLPWEPAQINKVTANQYFTSGRETQKTHPLRRFLAPRRPRVINFIFLFQSFTRDISHSMGNLIIYSLLRWKLIVQSFLVTLLNHFLFDWLGEFALWACDWND